MKRDLNRKSSLKALLIAVGMSVCISGLVASLTECMESDLNAQNFDVEQFLLNVQKKSVTKKEEKAALEEIDERLKNGSLDENLIWAFIDFMEYKIKEQSLDPEIEKWILDNTKRICEENTKPTTGEEGVVGDRWHVEIFRTFMKAEIKANGRLDPKIENFLIKQIMIISKIDDLSDEYKELERCDCYEICNYFIRYKVEADSLDPEIEDYICRKAKMLLGYNECYKVLVAQNLYIHTNQKNMTYGDAVILGHDKYHCGGFFKTFIESKMKVKRLDPKIEDLLFNRLGKMFECVTSDVDHSFIKIFQSFMEAKIDAKSLTKENEEIFCKMMLNLKRFDDFKWTIYYFVEKVIGQKCTLDTTESRKIFVEYAEKIVKDMNERNAAEEKTIAE